MTPWFSPQEVEVLECLASFWSVDDISDELDTPSSKVRSAISSIRKKLALEKHEDTNRIEQYEQLCNIARTFFQPIHYYGFSLPHE